MLEMKRSWPPFFSLKNIVMSKNWLIFPPINRKFGPIYTRKSNNQNFPKEE
jgi:hypothetical protein